MVSKFVKSRKWREALFHVYCILVLLCSVYVKHMLLDGIRFCQFASKQRHHLSEMREKLLHTVNWGLHIEARELLFFAV